MLTPASLFGMALAVTITRLTWRACTRAQCKANRAALSYFNGHAREARHTLPPELDLPPRYR